MPLSSDRRACAPLGRMSLVFAAALAAAAFSAISRPALAELAIEAVDRSLFRVCADPDNPPRVLNRNLPLGRFHPYHKPRHHNGHRHQHQRQE